MRSLMKHPKEKPIPRRRFLTEATTSMMLTAPLFAGCTKDQDKQPAQPMYHTDPVDPRTFWRPGDFFVQENVDTASLEKSIIRSKVDGIWRDFVVVSMPMRYIRWSLGHRIARLENLAQSLIDHRELAGPHNACVATYGGSGRDSAVSLNTAFKGMGFVPRKERIGATIQEIETEKERIESRENGDFMAIMAEKTNVLRKLYGDVDLFDSKKQISMELFTTPHYMTHTFLNMMANPIASFSFLAYPTFELRAIPQLLHHRNPALTEYERQMVAYVNLIHSFIHGQEETHIACVYHIIEVYDDTPSDDAKGMRLA